MLFVFSNHDLYILSKVVLVYCHNARHVLDDFMAEYFPIGKMSSRTSNWTEVMYAA